MALPPEHRTPRVEALQVIVDSTPLEKRIDFPVLQPPDHQMIDVFIQLFNYMDFNLRRAIETFAYAKFLQGEAAKRYPKIHSSKVASTVQDSVKSMDATVEDIPETIRILAIIERRREIRNMLSHWATRRITALTMMWALSSLMSRLRQFPQFPSNASRTIFSSLSTSWSVSGENSRSLRLRESDPPLLRTNITKSAA